MSIATCGKCGAAWNVAGLAGVASIPCQRCGAVIPLASAPPQPWAQLAAGGAAEGILASPLPQGTPVSDNAIQCPSCGTVLDAAGLAVGTTLRCGRCQKTFPRPAPFAGQPTMAVPAGSPDPGGDLTLELKETFRCDHCGREYYEEELPEPDEKRQIRCKKCGRVMRDLAEEEEEDEEDDEGAEKADRGKPKKERGELRGLGRRRRGLGRGGKRKGKREPEPPPPPQKVILDEKFKTDVMNFFRAGDEDAALERCMKLVDGREKQARQIYDHLHKIAKSKNWIGTAKPKPPLAAPKPAPPPRPTPPPVAVPAPPPTPPPAPPPMIRHQQATLLAASQPPPGAAPAPSAPTGLREGGPQIGGASPGFGPSRYKPPGLGVRTSGPNLAEAQAQTFGTPTAPLGASQAPPPSVTPAPAPPPLAPLPPLQPASSQGSLPPAFAPPAATAPTAHFPPPVRREEPPAPPSEEEGLEDLPPSPEN
ncbi:hypothetical protein HY251_14770, partial [bacterium]|nr:hypothetical protein [bacterium]